MSQNERLHFLLDYLIKESARYLDMKIPNSIAEQKQLLRSFMNIRAPKTCYSEVFENSRRIFTE